MSWIKIEFGALEKLPEPEQEPVAEVTSNGFENHSNLMEGPGISHSVIVGATLAAAVVVCGMGLKALREDRATRSKISVPQNQEL